eukprot:Opistho-2@36946
MDTSRSGPTPATEKDILVTEDSDAMDVDAAVHNVLPATAANVSAAATPTDVCANAAAKFDTRPPSRHVHTALSAVSGVPSVLSVADRKDTLFPALSAATDTSFPAESDVTAEHSSEKQSTVEQSASDGTAKL